MPQAAIITVNDGKSTPTPHNFAPSKVSDLIATFYGPGSTLAGREQLVVTRREATASVAGKVNLKIVLPTEVVQADGSVLVDHQELVSIDIVSSPKGSKQNRKDSRVLAANLLQHATIAAIVDDAEGVF